MAQKNHADTIAELEKAKLYIEHQEALRAKGPDHEAPKAKAHGMNP